jgi:hypothetical protein
MTQKVEKFFGKANQTFELNFRFEKGKQKIYDFFSWRFWAHQYQIKKYQKIHARISKSPNTLKRSFWVIVATLATAGLVQYFGLIDWSEPSIQQLNSEDRAFVKLSI